MKFKNGDLIALKRDNGIVFKIEMAGDSDSNYLYSLRIVKSKWPRTIGGIAYYTDLNESLWELYEGNCLARKSHPLTNIFK